MLRIVFAGSPECAVPSLQALAKAHTIVAVLTNEKAPAGRSGTPVPTPVSETAARLKAEGLIAETAPILEIAKLTDEVRDRIRETNPDLLACFAFGMIFGPKTLSLFPKGALNLHPSLLPRWRGATPVPAAILAGDAETGITVQKMALGMDEGDIIIQTRIPLTGKETSQSLLAQAATEGAPLLVEAANRFERGETNAIPQRSEDATYCSTLTKEDGRIDWKASAREIDARIRAFTPWPLAFTTSKDQTLIIHGASVYMGTGTGNQDSPQPALPPVPPGTVRGIDKKEGILVQTGEGLLALTRLQWRSKKELDWKSFINGSRDFVGSCLGPCTPEPNKGLEK